MGPCYRLEFWINLILERSSECIKNSSVKWRFRISWITTKWVIRRKISLLEIFQREEYFLMLIMMECHCRTLSVLLYILRRLMYKILRIKQWIKILYYMMQYMHHFSLPSFPMFSHQHLWDWSNSLAQKWPALKGREQEQNGMANRRYEYFKINSDT